MSAVRKTKILKSVNMLEDGFKETGGGQER